uniref:Putative secreted protein n=1 Tax=Anopheles triannulatus TaxID=58253 RepID=A0A2M4B7R0_9DIPT
MHILILVAAVCAIIFKTTSQAHRTDQNQPAPMAGMSRVVVASSPSRVKLRHWPPQRTRNEMKRKKSQSS